MSKLTEELKNEHAAVAAGLEKVKKIGVGSKEGQEIFFFIKEALLQHLKKEDEQLYPVLKKAAQNNPRLARTLSYLSEDMVEVTTFALKFFEKYGQGQTGGMEFSGELGKLFALLGDRIRKEEAILCPEYDKLQGS